MIQTYLDVDAARTLVINVNGYLDTNTTLFLSTNVTGVAGSLTGLETSANITPTGTDEEIASADAAFRLEARADLATIRSFLATLTSSLTTADTSLVTIQNDLSSVLADLLNADVTTIAALNRLSDSTDSLVNSIGDLDVSLSTSISTNLVNAVNTDNNALVAAVEAQTSQLNIAIGTTLTGSVTNLQESLTVDIGTTLTGSVTSLEAELLLFKNEAERDANSLVASIPGINPVGGWIPASGSIAEIENDKIRQSEYYSELWNVINWVELQKRQDDGEDVDPLAKVYNTIAAQFTILDPTATNIKIFRDNPVYRTRF